MRSPLSFSHCSMSPHIVRYRFAGAWAPTTWVKAPTTWARKCVKSKENSGSSRIWMVLWVVLTGSAPSTCFENLRPCNLSLRRETRWCHGIPAVEERQPIDWHLPVWREKDRPRRVTTTGDTGDRSPVTFGLLGTVPSKTDDLLNLLK